LESSTVFSGLSNNIQNYFINSISIILINEIKTEITSCKLKIFLELLENLRNDFSPIWHLTKEQFDLPNLRKRNKCRVNREVDIETTYRKNFIEIIDNMKEEINIRFNSLDDIIFLQLLDTNKYEMFSKCFPENILTNLKKHFHPFLISLH